MWTSCAARLAELGSVSPMCGSDQPRAGKYFGHVSLVNRFSFCLGMMPGETRHLTHFCHLSKGEVLSFDSRICEPRDERRTPKGFLPRGLPRPHRATLCVLRAHRCVVPVSPDPSSGFTFFRCGCLPISFLPFFDCARQIPPRSLVIHSKKWTSAIHTMRQEFQ